MRRFLGLPAAERLISLEIAGRILLVRLALFILPFSSVSRFTRSVRGETSPHNPAAPIHRVGTLVERIGGRLPGASCLVRALTGQWVLARRGIPSEVRFGVRDAAGEGVGAHAWLESRGEMVVGADRSRAYAPLRGRGAKA